MPPDLPKRPLPRPDGLPRISPGGDQPEREAVRMPRAEPPKRTATLPGIPSLGVPPLPGELAPTKPAPANPLEKRTWRLPTPPSALAQARRTPVPPSDDPPARADAATGQPDASAELMEARAKLAEYERRERVQAEARGPGPYQPPLRSQSPVPSSAPTKADAALGKVVRTTATGLAERYGLMPLLLVFGIGGGVTAIVKPAADPAKTDAVLASQEAMRADVALIREQMAGVLKREAARDQYTQCLEEVLDDVGEQVLPAQDRLGSAAPLRAYIKQRCRRLRP